MLFEKVTQRLIEHRLLEAASSELTKILNNNIFDMSIKGIMIDHTKTNRYELLGSYFL